MRTCTLILLSALTLVSCERRYQCKCIWVYPSRNNYTHEQVLEKTAFTHNDAAAYCKDRQNVARQNLHDSTANVTCALQ